MYSQAYKRYVALLLLLIYIFNQVDRLVFCKSPSGYCLAEGD